MSLVMASGLLAIGVTPSSAVSAATLSCTSTSITLKAMPGVTKSANLSTLAGCQNSVTGGNIVYKANYAIAPAVFTAGASLVDTATTAFTDPAAVGYTAQNLAISDPTNFRLTASVAGTFTITVAATPYDLAGTPAAGTPTDLTITFITASTTAPSCTSMSGYTAVDTLVQLQMTANYSTIGVGCTGTGTLSFEVSSATYGSAVANGQTVDFTPQAGYQTPQAWTDNSQRASVTVRAIDEYGNASGWYTIYIHVAGAIACNAPLKNEVLFNSPAGKDAEQFRITNRMLQYIDCAGSGTVITMSWFSLTDLDFVYHLQAAKNRGAEIRFLINSHATKSVSSSFQAWTSLKQVLGTSPADAARNGSNFIGGAGGSWAMYCNAGCLTPLQPAGVEWPADSEAEYPALHSKFMMLSNISGKRVIAIASSNPTRAQAVQGWNNAQFIVESIGKDKLFPQMDAYFARLSAEGCTDSGCPAKRDHPESYQSLTKIGEASFTTFPRKRVGKTANSDDIFLALDSLLKSGKCIYKDAQGKYQRTQVYVNMFVFTRNSPAMALWRLANQPKAKGGGCDVHVIYTDMDQAMKLNGQWITKKDGYVNWGALDCLTTPATVKGKYKQLTKTERRPLTDEDGNLVLDAKGKKRFTTAQVCSRGTLQGTLPTINRGGGLCWFASKSKVSGGSLDVCVSTPLSVTIKDKADNRAKLEPVEDTEGRTRYSHQKYMLIGTYNKSTKTPEYYTYSGTPNFSNPGLRWNDEILITSTSAETYAQYLDNYQDMKRWIKSRPFSNLGARKCGIYTSC